MNPPNGVAAFASAEGMPRDADEPVFAEPWEAQAFALAVQLHQAGYFTWTEWVETLATVLHEADDDGSRYYEHWLAALERLSIAKGLTNGAALARRVLAWEDAFRRTPHGEPVVIGEADT